MSELSRLYVVFDANGKPYLRGLKDIEGQTHRSASTMEKTFDRAGKAAGAAIATGLAVGAAAVVGIGVASVKAAAQFEYEMSRIKANANGTAAELEALEDTVLQLGKDTVFSAGQSAQAANELVKAGLDVGDTMAALPGMLALASAGELGVAQAAEITANQLSVFRLKAEDAGKVADTLALAANRSTTEVTDLGMSLAMSASVASQAGLTLQETAAILALLANNGLKGSDAGTSLKTMLMMLMAPTKDAKALMEQYGIEIYDATGKMKSMEDIIGELTDATAGLTDEEANYVKRTIAGQDAIRAVNILLKEGVGAFQDMTAEVSTSGAALDIAATKMDNLKGSWEQLKGSIETAGIVMGKDSLMPLRGILDELTQQTNEFIESWERMAGTTAWQQGGFEVKFDMAADTIMDAVTELLDRAGEAVQNIDWVSVGRTVGEAAVAIVGAGLKLVVRDLVPMLIELTIGLVEGLLPEEGGWAGSRPEEIERHVTRFGRRTDAMRAARLPSDNVFRPEQAAYERLQAGYESTFVGEVLDLKQAQVAAELAEGLEAVAEAAALAAENEAAAEYATDLLRSAFEGIVDPADAWTTALKKTEEAGKGAAFSLSTFITELETQLANWEGLKGNLSLLVAEWGDEYDEAVILEAAKHPDLIAALVDSDPETVRRVFGGLKAALAEEQVGIDAFVNGLYADTGTGASTSMADAFESYWRAFAASVTLTPPTVGAMSTQPVVNWLNQSQSFLNSHPLQPRVARPGGIIGGEYDSGGYLPPGVSIAINNTGAPEPVGVTAAAEAARMGLLGASPSMDTSAPAGGGLNVKELVAAMNNVADRVEVALRDSEIQRAISDRQRRR